MMFPPWCINEGGEGLKPIAGSIALALNTKKLHHCVQNRQGVGLVWENGIGVKVTNVQSFQRGCFSFIFHSLVRRKVP